MQVSKNATNWIYGFSCIPIFQVNIMAAWERMIKVSSLFGKQYSTDPKASLKFVEFLRTYLPNIDQEVWMVSTQQPYQRSKSVFVFDEFSVFLLLGTFCQSSNDISKNRNF